MIGALLAALRPADLAPGRPCWASATLRHHAGPEWLLALLCALLLLPPLSHSAAAEGLATAVRLQVLLCLLDLPVLYLVAHVPGARRTVAATTIGLAYAAVGAGFAWFAWDRVGSRLDLALMVLLPLALRAWALVRSAAEIQRAALSIAFSLGLIAPWMLCFVLVLLPVSAVFGLQTPVAGTDMVEFSPAAWLAMGLPYFALAGLGRYMLARALPLAEMPAAPAP